jgi:hypothetical protein
MSFVLEIDVPNLTFAQADAVAKEVEVRRTWPISVERKGLIRKQPRLFAPSDVDGAHLLADEAEWDEPAWKMNESLLPRLAETIRVLGEILPQGFTFRATWVSDPTRDEKVLLATELAELVLASELNEYTSYRVTSDGSSRE